MGRYPTARWRWRRGDAAWIRNDVFGARCGFEADGRLVKERPELEVQQHPQVGFKLHVLEPGAPSTMYHRETDQEDFLVLSGECLLLVEGEERRLRAWDSSIARRTRPTRSWAPARAPA